MFNVFCFCLNKTNKTWGFQSLFCSGGDFQRFWWGGSKVCFDLSAKLHDKRKQEYGGLIIFERDESII